MYLVKDSPNRTPPSVNEDGRKTQPADNGTRTCHEGMMAYRNKVYIAFDADSDIRYYRLMQAWKQNDCSNFDFNNAHELNTIQSWSTELSIKSALRERMKNTKTFILLVGEKTKFQNTYVRWEIELALKQDLPIIAANINGKRSMDESRCPLILRDKLAMHVSYNPAIIQYALENWTNTYQVFSREGKLGPYYYQDSIYKRLGL
jgi:hypothetical protein